MPPDADLLTRVGAKMARRGLGLHAVASGAGVKAVALRRAELLSAAGREQLRRWLKASRKFEPLDIESALAKAERLVLCRSRQSETCRQMLSEMTPDSWRL